MRNNVKYDSQDYFLRYDIRSGNDGKFQFTLINFLRIGQEEGGLEFLFQRIVVQHILIKFQNEVTCTQMGIGIQVDLNSNLLRLRIEFCRCGHLGCILDIAFVILHFHIGGVTVGDDAI